MKTVTLHRLSVALLILCAVFFGFVLASFFPVLNAGKAVNSLPTHGTAGPHWREGVENLPELSFTEISERWSEAIVNIEARSAESETQKEGLRLFSNDTSPKGGTGIIIDSAGHVLTNWHVVEDSNKITIRLMDDTLHNASVIGADKETDLALLKMDTRRTFRPAILGNSDDVKPGEWVVAIGNPSGFRHTLTVGVVSAIGRNFTGNSALANFIQTDAAINPGNSGGPLMNTRGEVIGINTLILEQRQNLGFSIPINLAKMVISQLKESGRVARGYMGLTPGAVTPEIAQVMSLPSAEGAIVQTVQSQINGVETPAARAGFQVGDIITRFNGTHIDNVDQIYMLAAYTPPGEEVEVEILRAGQRDTLRLTLMTRPSSFTTPLTIPLQVRPSGGYPLGLKTETAGEDLLDLISNTNGTRITEGVKVVEVEVAGLAFNYNIRAGMVITTVNGNSVGTHEEFSSQVRDARAKGLPIVLYVARGAGVPGLSGSGNFISFPAE